MINFNKTKEAPPETSKSHVLAQSAFSDEPKRAPEEAIKNWKGAQEAPYEMHVEADRPFYLGEKRIFEGERKNDENQVSADKHIVEGNDWLWKIE